MVTTRDRSFELPIEADAYLRGVFLNEDFAREMHLRGLEFEHFEVLEFETAPSGEVRRRLRVRPRMNAPAAVRKVLGGTQQYEESGRLAPGSRDWIYGVVPSTLQNRISIAGTQRVEPVQAASCRVTFEIRFEVRMLGVGRAIERFMADQFEDNLKRQEAFTRQWLALRGER